jgi:hypothetical protein
MKGVVANFALNVKRHQKNAGNTKGQAYNIYDRVYPVFQEIAPRNGQVVMKHKRFVHQ